MPAFCGVLQRNFRLANLEVYVSTERCMESTAPEADGAAVEVTWPSTLVRQGERIRA